MIPVEIEMLDAEIEMHEEMLLDNALRARCPSGPAPEWPDDEED